MDTEAAKMIGAGLAMIALAGVGFGIGHVFSSSITAVGRNPAAKDKIMPLTLLGFALTEAVGLFALLMAFLIMFT